jgi:hypothetical protein
MSLLHSQTEIEKNVFEVSINYSDLRLDKKEIELTLGYLDNTIPKHFSELIDEIISHLPDKCKIKAGYCIAEIDKNKAKADGLKASDKFFKMDKIVTGQLSKAEWIAFFVCTIGPGMEQWSKKCLEKGDPATAYLIDTVASNTVENVADSLHDLISREMDKKGLKVTNRYSPGYCDWSVSEQHLLFSFFPKNFCEITLTDSSLMLPIKSISGVVGIGKDVKWKEYLCDKCGMKDCTYRSKRKKKNTA